MDNKVTSMFALILLFILIIIVIVGLSWNPAPAEIVVKPQTASQLLMEKTKNRVLPPNSSMSPSTRNQLSPNSVTSNTASPWEALDKMREERKERELLANKEN